MEKYNPTGKVILEAVIMAISLVSKITSAKLEICLVFGNILQTLFNKSYKPYTYNTVFVQ